MKKFCILAVGVMVAVVGAGAAKKPTLVPSATAVVATPKMQTDASAATTGSGPMGAVAQELMEAQEAIGDLTADFTLLVPGAGKDGSDITAQGKMWVTTGRRYAVQYEQPERQRLVSDGNRRWLYLERINQVQIQSLPPAGNPNDFFLELGGGMTTIIKKCTVSKFDTQKDKVATIGFELVPKAGSQLEFKRARLWLTGKDLLPVRVVVDASRQVRVEFSQVKIHTLQELVRDPEKGLPASTFTFEPPAQAEVIELF
ncbi:outer membrane lipoprotein carrier protein LolA [candidate division FCPU426 bacterium]|nr:outer membrane lipoprotein carrier protein LolA [candidate division FCPU426 bacterium]